MALFNMVNIWFSLLFKLNYEREKKKFFFALIRHVDIRQWIQEKQNNFVLFCFLNRPKKKQNWPPYFYCCKSSVNVLTHQVCFIFIIHQQQNKSIWFFFFQTTTAAVKVFTQTVCVSVCLCLYGSGT